jgi:hypothetical protein
MTKKVSPKIRRRKIPINWQKLYKEFSAPISSINCGVLCAPRNGGVPHCCTFKNQEPVLFTSELAWLKTRTSLWRQMPVINKNDRRRAAEIEDYIKYAHCKGAAHCERRFRSLTCRFFPLEPYFEPGKKFVGLTFMYRAEAECPLIDHPEIAINQGYVDQAITVWKELFIAYPREVECYCNVSRGLRTSMKRKGRMIKVFSASS